MDLDPPAAARAAAPTIPPGLPAEPSTELRLDDQLCFALYAATNAVIRAYRPLLAELDLTYTQYVVMMALWERDGLTVGELAHRLGITSASTTPVLDRLEGDGLLERRRGTPDRRTVGLHLTDAGRALEQPTARAQHRVRCQTLLDDDALGDLRSRLQHLTRTLDTSAIA